MFGIGGQDRSMGDGGPVDGWRVVRSRRAEFVDAGRLRRRTVVCGATAVVVGAFLVVADVVWGSLSSGSGVRDVLAVVLLAGAVGCLVAPFVRVAAVGPVPLEGVTGDRPTGDWRRQERIDRQFAPRPPAMAPEDRDEVIARAERSIGPSTVLAERFVWLPVAWMLGWLGVLVAGAATTDRLTLLLVPPVFAVLQSATFIAAVTGAGRAEAARRRALAMPEVSQPSTPPQPRRAAGGSAVELPGDRPAPPA